VKRRVGAGVRRCREEEKNGGCLPTLPAPASLPLSTVSEIMCCGYTGVTALRPDVGGGLRTYVRAAALSSSHSHLGALYIPLPCLSFRAAR